MNVKSAAVSLDALKDPSMDDVLIMDHGLCMLLEYSGSL